MTRRRANAAWDYTISGPAWGGQSPIAGVEVQVDGGAWQRATLDGRREPYAWRLWSLTVPNLAAESHRLVSRAIDATGTVQPTKAERDAEIASGREDNAQWIREIRVEP